MLLPHHNAHLTSVTAPGTPADYGTPAGTGTVKWSGDCQVLLVDRTFEQPGGNELNIVSETIVTVPANLPTKLVDEDVLTLKLDNGTTLTRRVRQIDTRPWFGLLRVRLWSD